MPRRREAYTIESRQKLRYTIIGNIAGRLPPAMLENPIIQLDVYQYADSKVDRHAKKHGLASKIYHAIYPKFAEHFMGQEGSKLRALVQAITMLALRLYKKGYDEDYIRNRCSVRAWEVAEDLQATDKPIDEIVDAVLTELKKEIAK